MPALVRCCCRCVTSSPSFRGTLLSRSRQYVSPDFARQPRVCRHAVRRRVSRYRCAPRRLITPHFHGCCFSRLPRGPATRYRFAVMPMPKIPCFSFARPHCALAIMPGTFASPPASAYRAGRCRRLRLRTVRSFTTFSGDAAAVSLHDYRRFGHHRSVFAGWLMPVASCAPAVRTARYRVSRRFTSPALPISPPGPTPVRPHQRATIPANVRLPPSPRATDSQYSGSWLPGTCRRGARRCRYYRAVDCQRWLSMTLRARVCSPCCQLDASAKEVRVRSPSMQRVRCSNDLRCRALRCVQRHVLITSPQPLQLCRFDGNDIIGHQSVLIAAINVLTIII